MKKKLLSLLLVVVVMMTSVSIGFSVVNVTAAATGGGVEAINAFSLTAPDMTGSSYSGQITIKSKVSGYQIKVNTISAMLVHHAGEGTNASGYATVSYTAGTVCSTSGQNFTVSGSFPSGYTAGAIRYEVGYDLLDANGNVVYAGMTGIGHSAVAANGNQTGALGTQSGEPARPGDRYSFVSFGQINSIYVQTPSIVLTSHQRTGKNAISGAGSQNRTISLSGTYPNTITVRDLHWDYVEMYGEGNVNTTWFEMNSMPNGYYNFTINYNGSAWHNVQMYYRSDSAKSNALSHYNTFVNLGLEKSYYTQDSWNAYMHALDITFLVGRGFTGATPAFQVACQYADIAAQGAVQTYANNLVPVGADYSAFNTAYSNFNAVKDNTVTVRTYDGGTSTGSTTIRLYTQAAADAVVNYYNSCNKSLYKYDQLKVDNYTATINSMTANLTYSDAVYTYLDKAITEYNGKTKSHYTNQTWAAYEAAVDSAKLLSRSLKANSQGEINTALTAIVNAKIKLELVSADTTNLLAQINNGDIIYSEYDAGKLLTAAPGFAEAWDNFEAAYKAATAVKGYKIDKQAEVDAAANALAETIAILSDYRPLDTTELKKVTDLTPEYAKSQYVADSYNAWNSLRVEGLKFLNKADPSYAGEDRKTYSNLAEMNRLIKAIQDSYDGLEKVKADFTELNAVIAQIPSEEDLALYKPEIVESIKGVVATINYGATFDQQDTVDEIADNLTALLATLTPENYRDADYSKVEEAKAAAQALNRNEYTNFEIVDEAINNVVYGKKIVDQADVDAMAKAINDAIKALQYIPADYTDVYAAIAEAEAIENKDYYANYYRIDEIIAGIDWNVKLDDQAIVDGYAADIREAIGNLILAEADYSGVRAAIQQAYDLEPLSDYNQEYIDRLDAAIAGVVAGYTKDRQAEVDAMEAAIRAVLAEAEENLLPADYSKLNMAISYAESFVESEYSNYQIVKDAINAVNWNLNCRQTAEMEAQTKAIYDAVEKLKLLPADYSKVEEAIAAARDAYANGAYPYTEESIAKVEAAIATIDWDLDVQHQAEVNAYIAVINQAVAGLTYIRADYTGLEEALAAYRALQRDLYASLGAIDSYVASINMNITIDKQDIVDGYEANLYEMIENLEYAPADYSAITNAIGVFSQMTAEHYDADQYKAVEDLIASIPSGLTKDKQAEVDQKAAELAMAIDVLATTLKNADLTALNKAIADAQAKLSEMSATGYELDYDSFLAVRTALTNASGYNEETKINKQAEIDKATADIIEATANLEFVFTIDLSGTDLVIDNDGYIYGFEEGTMAEDARDLIKFVGSAELKIYETKNGFGTGTMIQFVSTKDGSILGTYTVLVFGDANGDSVIDTYDVAYITEVVNSGEDPSATLLKVLDLFKDGYIDAMDVAMMISLANMDATLMQNGTMGTY